MNPRVGIAVIIVRDGTHILMGERHGSHGSGTLAFPGGHLEFGEDFKTCAERETLEETDLQLQNVRFFTAANSVWGDEKLHYVTIFMVAEAPKGIEPKLMEPHKCKGWEWVARTDLEKWGKSQITGGSEGPKLFLPVISLFKESTKESPFIGL